MIIKKYTGKTEAEATEAAGAIEATVTAEALETAEITVTAGSAEAAEVTGTAEDIA